MKVDYSGFEDSVKLHLNTLSQEAVRAAEQAAYEIRNQAAIRTPVNTGTLRSGWQVRIKKGLDFFEATIYNQTKYAAAVEYGSKPRTIRAKNKKVLANKKKKQVFGKKVNHPGTKPKPMLRPAIAIVIPKLKAKLRRIL